MRLMLVVMHPPPAVIEAVCEDTCALAEGIDYVDSARLARREVRPDGRVLSVQHWQARANVPKLLRPHLDGGLLRWTLTIEREPNAATCRWHAESSAIQVPGQCRGSIDFHPAAGGRGTRLDVQAAFETTHEGLRAIFGRMLAQHWRLVADAAGRRLAASAPGA